MPHDAVVAGAVRLGDVGDLVSAQWPRAVLLDRCVDGVNRRVGAEDVAKFLALDRRSARARVSLDGRVDVVTWLTRSLGVRDE